MSIASEITRIQTAKENIRTSNFNKGGTLSSNAPIDEYASAISSIPTSSGTTDYGLGVLIYEGTFANTTGTFSVTTLPNGESFSFDKIVVELSNVFQGQNVNKRTYWRSDKPMTGYDEPLIVDNGSNYRQNVTYHSITNITIEDDTYIGLATQSYDENNPTASWSTYQHKAHNGYDKITAYGWWSWNCPAEARIKIVGYKRKDLTLIPKTITVNGTYIADDDNADGYSNVTVNAQGGGQWTTEGIASGTQPSGEIHISDIRLVRNAFSYNSAITKVKGENLYGAYNVFDSCSALTEWNLHFIELGYVNMFSQNCPVLKKVVLKIDRVNGSGAFLSGCSELEIADFTVPNIRGTTFIKCYKFQTLIIRNTSNVIPLDNISAFENTPFRGYNDLSGTIYVPQALIEDYKTANNWSTIFAEGHLTFLSLEESEWANKYADGTLINNEN